MCFFVQTNHTRKELLFLMFKEINLRNHSSLHKLFYSLFKIVDEGKNLFYYGQAYAHFSKKDKKIIILKFLFIYNFFLLYFLIFFRHFI